MKVVRAAKYGFCAGVRIADIKVKKFAAGGNRGAILGQVVHNERVVEEMEAARRAHRRSDRRGRAGTIVFSAHGVPPSFHHRAARAASRSSTPLARSSTTSTTRRRRRSPRGRTWCSSATPAPRGDRLHPRPRPGVLPRRLHGGGGRGDRLVGVYPAVKILYQTTLNAEEYEAVARYIEARAADVRRADTICYATKENQEAAHALGRDPEVGVILVIGGKQLGQHPPPVGDLPALQAEPPDPGRRRSRSGLVRGRL
jgi:hypothetical protein